MKKEKISYYIQYLTEMKFGFGPVEHKLEYSNIEVKEEYILKIKPVVDSFYEFVNNKHEKEYFRNCSQLDLIQEILVNTNKIGEDLEYKPIEPKKLEIIENLVNEVCNNENKCKDILLDYEPICTEEEIQVAQKCINYLKKYSFKKGDKIEVPSDKEYEIIVKLMNIGQDNIVVKKKQF